MSDEIKHTPGPWHPMILDRPLAEIPAYVAECIEQSGGKDFYFVAGFDEVGQCDISHVGNGPRGKANARLIAAAPDLLEALKDLDGLARKDDVNPDEYPRWWPAWEKVRAAIDKAEGRAG